MSLENDRVVEPLSRWAVELPSWLKVSRSLHFSLSFHKFHFSMMLLFEPLRSLRSAPTAELSPPCSRSTPGVPLATHTLRRRFTCKLIFNPNTANSLYGTALTLLSQQQVGSELSALWSQLSFRLVSCFFPFGFCISLPFWLLCKFTYNSNDHNTLRLSFTKHVYGLWNLLLSLSLEQMWVLLYYVFFWVWFGRVFTAWLRFGSAQFVLQL